MMLAESVDNLNISAIIERPSSFRSTVLINLVTYYKETRLKLAVHLNNSITNTKGDFKVLDF